MTRDVFDPVTRLWSHARRCVSIDYPRTGARDEHSLSAYARHVERVLQALDIDAAVVVGWSMGAAVMWRYLRDFGVDRVVAMVIVAQPPLELRDDDWPFGSLSSEELESVTSVIRGPGRVGWTERFVADVFSGQAPPGGRHGVLRGALEYDPEAAVSLVENLCGSDFRDFLEHLAVPSLLVYGAHDKLTAPGTALWMAAHLPHAVLATLSSSGHCPMVDEPVEFAAVVEEFADRVQPHGQG